MTAVATAAVPAAKRTRKPAPKPANPVLTPEQEADLKLAMRLEELKAAYYAAKTGETKTKGLLKDAKLAWENSRVITSRVAYAVAMLKPFEGAANLSYAARELHMSDADLALTGDALKRKKNSAKSSLRNYVNAGAALFAEGQDPENRVTEPDDVERGIVAEAFKAGNVRNTVDKPGAGTTEESAAAKDDAGTTETLPDALTIDDLTGHIGRLEATLKLMIAASVSVSEADAERINGMLAAFGSQLTEYAAGE